MLLSLVIANTVTALKPMCVCILLLCHSLAANTCPLHDTAARTLFKFRYCLFVDIFLGGCNIWHEYPIYLER